MLKTKIGNFVAFINGNSKKSGFNSIILRDPDEVDVFQIIVFQTYGASASFDESISLSVNDAIVHRISIKKSETSYSDSEAREIIKIKFPAIQIEHLDLGRKFPYYNFQDLYTAYSKSTNTPSRLKEIGFHKELKLKFSPHFLICYSTDYVDPSQNDLIGYLDYFQVEQTQKVIYDERDITTPVDYRAVVGKKSNLLMQEQDLFPALNPKYLSILDFDLDLNKLPLPIIKVGQVFKEYFGLDSFITYLTDKICKQNNSLDFFYSVHPEALYTFYKSENDLYKKIKDNSGFHNYLASKELGILNLLKIVNGEFYQNLKEALKDKNGDFLSSTNYVALTQLLYLCHNLQHNPLFVAAVLQKIEPEFSDIFKKNFSPKVVKMIEKLSVDALEKLSYYTRREEQHITKVQRNYHDLHTVVTNGYKPESLVNFDPVLEIFNEQTLAQSMKDGFGLNTRISRRLLRQLRFSWNKVKVFFETNKSPILFSTSDNTWVTQNLPIYPLEILAYQKHCFRTNNPFNTDREVYKQSFENFFKNFNERGAKGDLETYEDFVLILNHQNLVSNTEETNLALNARYSKDHGLNALDFVGQLKKTMDECAAQDPQKKYLFNQICPIKHSFDPQTGAIKSAFNRKFCYKNLQFSFSSGGLFDYKELIAFASGKQNVNKEIKARFDEFAYFVNRKLPVDYYQRIIDNIAAVTYGRCVNNISFSYQIYIHPEAIRNFKIDDYHFSFLLSRGGKAIQAKYDFDAFVALAPYLYSQHPLREACDPIDNDLQSLELRLIGKALQETGEFGPCNELYDCAPILPRINDLHNHNIHYGLSKSQSQLAINLTIYQFVTE